MSLFFVGISLTIVNIALPTIQQDLHAGVSDLQWVIDAYALVIASLLMLSGSTADRFGRRKIFGTGLVLFTFGSFLCSLAPNIDWLIAFRALQGIGGSMLNPVALSIISNVFTNDKERARALGVWAGVFGLSMAVGPLIGGLLLAAGLGWRSMFWINIPIGVCALLLTAMFVPESTAEHPRRLDPVGQVLVIALLTPLTFAIIEGPTSGWTSAGILACFAVSAMALVALLVYEPRRKEPLVELRYFKSIPFSGATAIALVAYAAIGGFALVTTLYLQDVRGFSALHTGLLFMPVAAAALVTGVGSGILVANRNPRTPLIIAGLMLALSAIMLTAVSATTSTVWLVIAYTIFGLGFGMVSAPINNTALEGMPRAQSGVAAAIVSSGRQVGLALGVAVSGSVIASNLHGPLVTDFIAASRATWWIAAGYGLSVAALAVVTGTQWARRTAAQATSHFRSPGGAAEYSLPSRPN